MKNVVIVHGKPSREKYYSPNYPSSSNFAWIPWLQKNLIINDIKADTPEMPHAYEPDYQVWKKEFERFDITKETALVGHSAGGAFILRWLSENKNNEVDKVILIAPSVHTVNDVFVDFLNYEIDFNLAQRVKELIVFTSDNDSENSKRNIETLKKIKDIEIEAFEGYGHFIPEHMGKNEFPELLARILE